MMKLLSLSGLLLVCAFCLPGCDRSSPPASTAAPAPVGFQGDVDFVIFDIADGKTRNIYSAPAPENSPASDYVRWAAEPRVKLDSAYAEISYLKDGERATYIIPRERLFIVKKKPGT